MTGFGVGPLKGQPFVLSFVGVKEKVCVFLLGGSFLPGDAHLLERDVFSSRVPGCH